jgi:hypothetical protein
MVSFEADILIGFGTNPDLVFLYKYCTVFSDKLAMETRH